MKKLILIFLFTLSATAQIKGIVKDSITKQPIGYAAVLIENTKTGVNTEEDGSFNFQSSEKANYLIISALGYHEKRIITTKLSEIFLSPKPNLIEEIKIQSKLQTSEIVVGNDKSINYSYGNGGIKHMWGKFIESSDDIAKHPYIKTLQFTSKSDVKNAKIKLRFFEVNNQGKPGDDYLYDDIVVTVKKGKNKNLVDLTKYNVKIPSEGLFVFFEHLIIEENRYTYEVKFTETNGQITNKTLTSYQPLIFGAKAEKMNIWTKSDKGSYLTNNSHVNNKHDNNPIQLAIKLTLTN